MQFSMATKIQLSLPGRISFEEGLRLQQEIVDRVARDPANETLILLEHDPVYTIGRTPDQSSLRDSAALPHPVFQINRGGQATYHGPGQLVGYAILDLNQRKRDLHALLRALEETLIQTCTTFSISTQRREGLTGVWAGNRKLASIGIGVRKWISMHGFALNVCGDLTPFNQIVPCGIQSVQMTSLSHEAGKNISIEEVIPVVTECFEREIVSLA